MTDQSFDGNQADSYAKARPTYPPFLFEKLASLTQRHDRAWDVGTGNGQAAVMIAEHYKSVIATDISEQQLSHAQKRPNITYANLSSTPCSEDLERVVGEEGSVDLVTVATALHYFDHEKFYPIVKHVLRKPGGVFAAWTYAKRQVSPELDKLQEEWYELVKHDGRPGVEYALEGYRSIPFPFEPVDSKVGKVEVESFKMETPMTLEKYIVLWESSSMVSRARERGYDILTEDRLQALRKAWGQEEVRTVTFNMSLLVGTVSPVSGN